MLSALANNPDSNRRRRYFIKYSPQNVESGKNRRNQVGQGCGGTGALMCVLVAQLCLTLDPMDSPPGSPVNRILQARIPEVGCHALLQGIFPTQGSNPGLLHCRQILYHLSHQGSPCFLLILEISNNLIMACESSPHQLSTLVSFFSSICQPCQ